MANTESPNVDTQLARGNGEFGYIIPAVKPDVSTSGSTKKVSYTDTAAWNTGALMNADGVGLIVYATTDCFVIFSVAATLTAVTTGTGMFIPGGVLVQLPYAGIQTFSAIRSAVSGDIYVTEIRQ
jgi:hypothetical protein